MNLGNSDAWPLAPFPAASDLIQRQPEFWLSLCSLFCGDLRCSSSGRLCCSSKRSLVNSGCCDRLCTGDCAPLGAGISGPICTRVSSTASPRGGLVPPPFWLCGVLPPPPRWSQQQCPCPPSRCRLHHEYQPGPVMCIAARPAGSSRIRSPTSWLATRAGPSNPTIGVHTCWNLL